MTNRCWNIIAWLLARPALTRWLIARAVRRPYTHIIGANGDVYMRRYWLFNPYPAESSGDRAWWHFPISIRLHHIVREDDDRDLHDHPWNARTLILDGWYCERRLLDDGTARLVWRIAGTSARLRFGEYHRIVQVPAGGVWTLFISGRYRGTWGFLVNGKKIPWRTYLGIPAATDKPKAGA